MVADRTPALTNRTAPSLRGGLHPLPTHTVLLGGFLVRRDPRFRGPTRLRGRFQGRRNVRAFDEVSFLLFVLLVRTCVHVLDAFHERLVFSRLLFSDLRLLVSSVSFQHRLRYLRREQPNRPHPLILP